MTLTPSETDAFLQVLTRCVHHEVCGLRVEPGESLCILHLDRADKDKTRFGKAWEMQRSKPESGTFVVFPDDVSIQSEPSSAKLDFSCAKFYGDVYIADSELEHPCTFQLAHFKKNLTLNNMKFRGGLDLSSATVDGSVLCMGVEATSATLKQIKVGGSLRIGRAVFGATDLDETSVGEALLLGESKFVQTLTAKHMRIGGEATFYKLELRTADFVATRFKSSVAFSWVSAEELDFQEARFASGATFAAEKRDEPLFTGTLVSFRDVIFEKPDAMVFSNCDLSKALFERTSVRKVRFISVIWPRIKGRFSVHDETHIDDPPTSWGAHGAIWQVLSELKNNYTEQGDHQTAGDFHYGAMEHCRRDKRTPRSHRVALTLYWLVSGYGERYVLPLAWAITLWLACGWAFKTHGLQPIPVPSAPAPIHAWITSLHYSLQMMVLQKPTDFQALGLGRFVVTAESMFGPLLLGFFALALRQRLRR